MRCRRHRDTSGPRCLFLFLLVVLAGGCRDQDVTPPAAEQKPSQPAASLVIPGLLERSGDVHRGTLSPGLSVTYPIPLEASEALLLNVDQAVVDVEVRIIDPEGKLLLLADTPIGRGAPEKVCMVAERSGVHSVAVTPFSGGGGYSIRLVRRALASDLDRLCFTGARRFQSAQHGGTLEREKDLAAAGDLWERARQPFLAGVAWREAASLRRDSGQARGSVALFEKALTLARQAGSAYLEVSVLNRLGLTLIDLGELAPARARLEEAMLRARAAKETWGYAGALTNLGWLDDLVGQPYRAIDRYSEALALWRRIGNPAGIAQTLQDMGIAYGALDYHDRALDLLAEAARLTRAAGDERREASVLLAQGWVHYLRGRPTQGLPALQRVLEIRRHAKDRNGEAAALDRQGTLLRAAGRYAEAEQSYLESLELSRTAERPLDVAATVANLGCLYSETGRLKEARERLADALERYEGGDDPRALAHVEYCLAKTAVAGEQLDDALGHVRRALQIVDRLRQSARTEGHDYRPIWLWQKYAELETFILFERYRSLRRPADLEHAFQAADMARARSLHERVIQARVGVQTAPDEVVLRAERALEEQLNQLAHARINRRGRPKPADKSVDSEIRRLKSELQRVRATIRANEQRHQATTPRPAATDLVKRLLAPRTALLSYVLGESRSHLLMLTTDGLSEYELPSRSEIESHALSFHAALQASRFGRAQWHLVAGELGRRVLPPGALPPTVDRLVVVADGLLHYVPFGALASPRGEGRFVGDDFDLSYAPSVSVLVGLREHRRDHTEPRVAVFADPVFSREEQRRKELRPAGDRGQARAGNSPAVPARSLSRLVFAAREARSIADAAGSYLGGIWTGHDATKKAILETDLRSFNILHFATHAWIDEQFPELSGLSMSRFNRQGRPIESELRLHEIHHLKLDADLTVLSGCQTALGEHVRGNGLEGLAHGFLYAGSSRVLVSLWNVDDEATALLMGDFYRRLLGAGAPPAAALRQSQQWLRGQPQFDSPYYWAPFILQGVD